MGPQSLMIVESINFIGTLESLISFLEKNSAPFRCQKELLGRFKGKSRLNGLRGICFIDLDRTLMRRTLAPSFGKWLYTQGKLTSGSLIKSAIHWAMYHLGYRSFEFMINAIFTATLKGLTKDELYALSTTFGQSLLPPSFDQRIVALMRQIDSTHLLVLSSRSPDFLVSAIAKALNFDIWQASTWCRVNREYRAISGNEKAELFDDLLILLGLDRSFCMAMSDSRDDIPLLQRAGRAIGVRPDRDLRGLALKRNWEIWDG